VLEPNASNVASVETNYTYDYLDRLQTVAMTRGGVTQTRTFVSLGAVAGYLGYQAAQSMGGRDGIAPAMIGDYIRRELCK
jgi:YD repeat-containing protein